MENFKKLAQKYRENGYKATPQRLSILESVSNGMGHFSVEEIYHRVKETNPSISLNTVYNTLQTLKGIGEVNELNITGSKCIYDSRTDPHHHVVCLQCKTIADVSDDGFKNIEVPNDVKMDFHVFGYHIHFYGLCRTCSDNQGMKE